MDKPADYKLPIFSLLREAADSIRANLIKLILMGAPFIITCIAAGTSMNAVLGDFPSAEPDFPIATILLTWLAMATTSIMAIVGCHRTFLLRGRCAENQHHSLGLA